MKEKEKEKPEKDTKQQKEIKVEPPVTNGKSSPNDDYCLPPPPIQTTARGGGPSTLKKPKGRIKRHKPKRVIKINGLDLLHTQTLLSTSPQGMYTKRYTYEIHCTKKMDSQLKIKCELNCYRQKTCLSNWQRNCRSETHSTNHCRNYGCY